MVKAQFKNHKQDILGHPNVKLFITHGGLGSFLESLYHATPLLVMPGFVDQERNSIGLLKHFLKILLKFIFNKVFRTVAILLKF